MQPHRPQPTRFPHPWDSPGKNTGVGCHFLLQMNENEKWKWSCSVVPNSYRHHGLQPTRLLHPWDFSRQEYWSRVPLPSKVSQFLASQVAQTVKNLPAMQEIQVQFPGWRDLLEKGMAIHSSIFAWGIPWTEEPGRYSPWGHKELDTTEWLTHTHPNSITQWPWDLSKLL